MPSDAHDSGSVRLLEGVIDLRATRGLRSAARGSTTNRRTPRGKLPADYPWIVDDEQSSKIHVVKSGAAAISVVQASQVDTPWSAEGVGARIIAKLAELKSPPAPAPQSPPPADAPPSK